MIRNMLASFSVFFAMSSFVLFAFATLDTLPFFGESKPCEHGLLDGVATRCSQEMEPLAGEGHPDTYHDTVEGTHFLQIAVSLKTDKDVCFFVKSDTATADTDGRARLAAVVGTWAAKPAAGSRVFYFVDEAVPPYHVPKAVQKSQIMKTLRTPYNQLSERMRQQLVWMNTKRLKDRCDWFALMDDDAYANTAGIVYMTSFLNASEPHHMGSIMIGGTKIAPIRFVHGSFQLISSAAMPILAVMAAECDSWDKGWDDVALGQCKHKLNISSRLPEEHFLSFVLNNTRVSHPSTLGNALEQSQKLNVSLDCFDVVHKLLPEDMLAYHALVKASPACTPEERSRLR